MFCSCCDSLLAWRRRRFGESVARASGSVVFASRRNDARCAFPLHERRDALRPLLSLSSDHSAITFGWLTYRDSSLVPFRWWHLGSGPSISFPSTHTSFLSLLSSNSPTLAFTSQHVGTELRARATPRNPAAHRLGQSTLSSDSRSHAAKRASQRDGPRRRTDEPLVPRNRSKSSSSFARFSISRTNETANHLSTRNVSARLGTPWVRTTNPSDARTTNTPKPPSRALATSVSSCSSRQMDHSCSAAAAFSDWRRGSRRRRHGFGSRT